MPVEERPARHLISLEDLSDADLRALVDRGVHYAVEGAGTQHPLEGLVAGIYFTKTSTRTRTAFSTAVLRLGGSVVTYGPGDLQTNTGETAEDTGRIMSRMLDLLVTRTAGDPQEMRMWARQSWMAVVNAMSSEEHPTQALADLTTLTRHFGRVEGLRVLYVGEGNNTAAALALALSRYPDVRLELRTPPGYGLSAAIAQTARRQASRSGAAVHERHDMDALPPGFDVIYTTRWQTTGTTKPDPRWHETFAPFQVGQELWHGSPEAVFMHDLPAHRGEEVTADVLDGPMSIAFDQAENKAYSAMAVLDWCRPVLPRHADGRPRTAIGTGRT
ncbi:ornithine carbamoyltransferase [Streptomyces hygroscopicus]|uniref:ornithine carbamoyltransferase n=1 Tax=Streptomyces hygroscopicus TaxID=1912 RepID=UPI00099E2B84|nr:ornithine carbamoyltransferase [Streptomyces hygroscopicus]